MQIETLLFDAVIVAGLHGRGAQLSGPPDPQLAAQQLAWLQRRTLRVADHSSSVITMLARLQRRMLRVAVCTADYLWLGAHYPVRAMRPDAPMGVEPTQRYA
jgi:hypothetical protein